MCHNFIHILYKQLPNPTPHSPKFAIRNLKKTEKHRLPQNNAFGNKAASSDYVVIPILHPFYYLGF